MNLGEDYDERVLPSITTEVLKAIVVSTLYLNIIPGNDLCLFWIEVLQVEFILMFNCNLIPGNILSKFL